MTAPPEVTLHLYDLHPEQRRVRAEARRFNVVAFARRAGKTTLGQDLVVETVLDDGARCAWFGPTYQNLAEAWRDLKDTLAPVTRKLNESEHRIEVLGGGVLECWSLDSEGVADSVRGRKYRRVFVDEAASVTALLDIWQKIIRPTLTDERGDAWFFSTPKGLNGFWVLYQRGQDPEQTDWASWRAPTGVNPHISAEEIENNRRDLPEQVFAQEFGAEFLSDGSGVFRGIDEAATARRQLVPRPGHRYAMGVDWGKLNDFTVISVADQTTGEQVHLERFNRIDYHIQTARLAIAAQTFRPDLILIEQNSVGEVLLERLQRMGLPVRGWVATNASKAALVDALSLVLERRQLRVLPDAVQLAELRAYAGERLLGGLVRYGAPAGMHDDCVIALGLSVLAAVTPTGHGTRDVVHGG